MVKNVVIVRWLWAKSFGYRGRIFACAMIGLIRVILGLLFIWFSKSIIDIATHEKDGNLYHWGFFIGATILLQIVCGALASWIKRMLDVDAQNEFRQHLFGRLLQGKWSGLEQFHSGDILNRISLDVRDVVRLFMETVPNFFILSFQLVLSFLFLWQMDVMLTWMIVLIMPFFVLLSKLYIKKMRRLTRDIRQSDSKIQSLIQESVQHRMVIKTLEQNDTLLMRLLGMQAGLRKQTHKSASFSMYSHTILSVGFAIGYLVTFLWGAFRLSMGTISFGVMTAFLQLVGQVQRPVVDIAQMIPGIISAFTASERLMELENLPLEETQEKKMLADAVGIRLENVTFSYKDSSKLVMDKFSYDFAPGSSTAILGETGAGKTTLIRMLMALIAPKTGKVFLYNDSQECLVSSATRCNLVYVPQGNTLFSGTIRENLLLGNPEATEEQLDEALYIATADFVSNLPQKMDTMCGEQGGGLSEGQAQRIAIARALLRPGKIFLFDESTSSLDMETEAVLLARLRTFLSNRTLIFVTHRQLVADQCDNVLKISM